MTHQAIIISRDAVFARMLLLELEENGFSARCEPGRLKTDEDAVYILDADSDIQKETATAQLNGCRTVSFSRLYSGVSAENGHYRLGRPFETRVFIEAVRSAAHDGAEKTTDDSTKLKPSAADSIGFTSEGIICAGREIRLTGRERRLLSYLMENRGKVVTREDAVRAVWNYDYTGNTNVVDVYIRYLREKLEGDGERIILTVRNKGYTIK